MRALAYIRVSVVGDRAARGRFESPDLQREQIDAWAARHAVTIVGEVQDLNKSGGTLTRPGLIEARRRLASGEADGIVVARSDRASRNVVQGLSMIDELAADGKWIAATDGTIDSTTPEARMATTIYLATSERELARFREQSAVVHRRAIIEKGRHMGPTPFGYVRDTDGRLAPDPERAAWVVFAYERRAAGVGWVQITRELGHVRQANGRPLNAHLLRRMIRHRVYLGEASHGEHVRHDAHPRLVDEGLWWAANRTVTAVRSGAEVRTHDESLLRGLLRCAGCRYVMKRLPQRNGSRWACRVLANEQQATHECESPARLTGREGADVERLVVDRFMELAAGIGVERAGESVDVTALERRAADAEALLDELSSLAVRRELGQDRWGRMVKEAREDARQAAGELAAARASAPVAGIGDVATVTRLWGGMTLTERQEALRSIIQAVMVEPAGDLAGRVHVVPVWADVELPRRGALFTARRWLPGQP